MTGLKRNQFRDDASSDYLPNGCGWLLDWLSSRGIHVVASSIFRRTHDDIDTSDVGGKFLLRSCTYVMMLNGYSTDYRQSSSLHTYVVLKTTMHGLSYALTLTLNTLSYSLCRLGIIFTSPKISNYIVHIFIDFMYRMPDFVLTIILLTLSCLPLLYLGLQ